jgi:hypothetical protein
LTCLSSLACLPSPAGLSGLARLAGLSGLARLAGLASLTRLPGLTGLTSGSGKRRDTDQDERKRPNCNREANPPKPGRAHVHGGAIGALDLSPSLLVMSGPPQGKDEGENVWSRIMARPPQWKQ